MHSRTVVGVALINTCFFDRIASTRVSVPTKQPGTQCWIQQSGRRMQNVGTWSVIRHVLPALSTAPEDVGDGHQGHENDTDPYSLSHLDPPTDSVYMICGVLIAMVLVGVIIVLLAVTISKLRKREDHHSSSGTVHPEATVVQTATSPPATIGGAHPDDCCTQISTTTTTTVSTDFGNNTCDEHHVYAMATTVATTPSANPVEPFAWQFPPPYPPPHMPAQYALYNDQNNLVHGLPSDRSGFAKGIRKNIGGRWRRLVKRKPEPETCTIPPELKDQLKTIYVY